MHYNKNTKTNRLINKKNNNYKECQIKYSKLFKDVFCTKISNSFPNRMLNKAKKFLMRRTHDTHRALFLLKLHYNSQTAVIKPF